MGKAAYPSAGRLLVTADGRGSDGPRNRLWTAELLKFADAPGLAVHVSHFPPGNSKWNKIEHRLFSRTSQNWRGRPLTSHEVIVSLIGSTASTTGLTVRAALDSRVYPTGVKVSDEAMSEVLIERAEFHGEWNYALSPKRGQCMLVTN